MTLALLYVALSFAGAVLCVNQSYTTTEKLEAGSTNADFLSTISTTPAPNITDSTCNSNDTTCSTVTTTSAPKSTTTKKPQSRSIQMEPQAVGVNLEAHRNFQTSMCTCDLQKLFCDVNCCCDPDCSFEDKQVFQTCKLEPNVHLDTSSCNYMDYGYVNSTPYAWEVTQNSLFCVAKTNLPARYTAQRKKVLETLEEADFEKRDRYSWSDPERLYDASFSVNQSFVYGADVWVMEGNVTKPFELPDSLITSACLIKQNVKFLMNLKRECSQTDLSESNPSLSARTYFANITIVRGPKYLQNFTYREVCPRNVCLPIEAKVCDESYEFCRPLPASNDSQLRVTCNSTTCLNAAQTIKYNLYHNGTRGFTKVELFLVLKNISRFQHEFSQQFEVSYFWWNYTTNYTLLLSGNPGYNVGKPLLIASLVPVYNTTSSRIFGNIKTKTVVGNKLSRNPFDITDNFLLFPGNGDGGECVLNNRTYVPSEFGYNMIVKCRLRKSVHAENATATSICLDIQKNIFSYWPISHKNYSQVNRFIGTFGNSNESVPSDWIRILSSVTPAQILNDTKGNYTRQNTSLTCRDLVTTLKIDVFHSRVDLEELLNQEKILGVTYTFANRKNFTFNFVEDGSFGLDFFIQEELMFYDVTSERIRRYVDPPSFRITLPYDFFYPFVKIDNGAGIGTICPSYISFLFIITSLCLS